MKRTLLAITLVLALCAGVLAPSVAQPAAASTSHAHPMFLDKTRFVLHMGFAYFAFHHFVWNKYKAGAFKSGASGRTANIIKAGIALLFAYHEVKVAYGIAKGSSSKTLQALVAPLDKLGATMSALGTKFKKGQYSDSDLTSLNTQANNFQSGAGKNGYGFQDKTVPVPGA